MGSDKKRKKKTTKHKKHKKSKHASSSDSSSDSGSSDSETSMDRRRSVAEKKARKLGKKLKTADIAGYTNEENPFGDTNLTERFVWHKKLEKQISSGVSMKDLGLRAEKQKQEQRLGEIERVKKRRIDREEEKEQMEKDMELLNRERAVAEAVELEKKEEEFHLKQAKERSTIRLRDGRGKPIDILSMNLNAEPEDFDLNSEDPIYIFAGLSLKEMKNLKQDIQMHMELDTENEQHREFWEAMLIVCEAEEAEATQQEARDKARLRGEDTSSIGYEAGLHASVDDDIKAMFQGKVFAELLEMEEGIDEMILNGDGEVEYWDAVLKRLKVNKSRVRLTDIHRQLWQRALVVQAPKQKQAQEEAAKKRAEERFTSPEDAEARVEEAGGVGAQKEQSEWDRPDEEEEEEGVERIERVAFSPMLISFELIPNGTEAMDPDDDAMEVATLRAEVAQAEGRLFSIAAAADSAPAAIGDQLYRKMLNKGKGTDGPQGFVSGMLSHIRVEDGADGDTGGQRAVASKMMGGADQGEVEFCGEAQLDKQAYWWHDKYRPRKPKYFNRVHTGYEWNKYNQTHYDHDNPPPKVVQGYKFNIFYPDLIDKVKAPTYQVVPDGSKHSETAMLIFHAGPPYEDIAFKIVNKDWEYSHKKGFKCSFERGIMHLYINFKRYRYRR